MMPDDTARVTRYGTNIIKGYSQQHIMWQDGTTCDTAPSRSAAYGVRTFVQHDRRGHGVGHCVRCVISGNSTGISNRVRTDKQRTVRISWSSSPASPFMESEQTKRSTGRRNCVIWVYLKFKIVFF